MRWLQVVGSLKSQVSFAKESYKRDDILQKRPMNLRSLLIVATLYGVATSSRLLEMIGLVCRISSLLQGSFAKETNNFKEPTNRSHPILPASLGTSAAGKFSQKSTRYYMNYVK